MLCAGDDGVVWCFLCWGVLFFFEGPALTFVVAGPNPRAIRAMMRFVT